MRQLTLIDKAFLLKKTNVFGSLDLDLLLSISDKMDLVRFREKEKVFQCDQNGHRMYLIVEGTVRVQEREGRELGMLLPGEFFGDESMFNDKPRAYEAICRTPVSLLALSRSHLLSIIAECPSVAIALLEAYSTHMDFRKR
jgi:CRP/FNR family cyclic AMP-dependent transcriptional regulator